MKELRLTTKEHLILLDTLCLRRDFVIKLLAAYGLDDDPKIFENYRKELNSINSILDKMGYF